MTAETKCHSVLKHWQLDLHTRQIPESIAETSDHNFNNESEGGNWKFGAPQRQIQVTPKLQNDARPCSVVLTCDSSSMFFFSPMAMSFKTCDRSTVLLLFQRKLQTQMASVTT